MARAPEKTNAYLVGGGIASLAAAVHLHHDAGVPANQIHIIEASPVPGGSMRRGGGKDEDDWRRGYVVMAARKLNFSYRCLYETLAKVPSARNPGRTVLDDVRGGVAGNSTGAETNGSVSNATSGDAEAPRATKTARAVKTNEAVPQQCGHPSKPGSKSTADAQHQPQTPSFPARLVATGPNGPEIVDVQSSIGLRPEERMGLLGLIMEPENTDDDREIQAHFKPEFFESKFWDMWASLYGFQPWHSTVEFRRYLVRFLHEFSHMGTLEGIDHAPLNDYECIIQPMEHHLKELGVSFEYETQVTGVGFAPGETTHIDELYTFQWRDSISRTIQVGESDIVFLTLGSMTSCVRFGKNDSPPPALPSQEAIIKDPGAVWKFWASLADPAQNPRHYDIFGRPQAFYSRMDRSSWLSFTITLAGQATSIFDHLKSWAGYGDSTNGNGATIDTTNSNGPLITFRDSPWMMSITMPHQPYFTGQPDDVCVVWGYGLYPDQEGMFVHKPMMECTGQEIFTELVSYLGLDPKCLEFAPAGEEPTETNTPGEKSPTSVITLPCLMPFIGSPFLTRSEGDRPQVLPENSDNLALLGQFVEMDRDVTFTMEYSARSAQMAVFHLMGLDRKPPEVHRGDRDVQVLGQMLLTLMS